MSSDSMTSILPLEESYSGLTHALCCLAITYAGIYVMLRNHFIFKPRIQNFLKRSKISSIALRELIIDFVSNLSVTTFLLSSILLTYKDKGVEIIIQNDMYWLGICMSILVYRNIKEQEPIDSKIIVKNAFFLIVTYGIVVYEYVEQSSILILGLVLVLIYLLNLLLNAYETKFVEFVEDLFNSKAASIENDSYVHCNQIESPEFLSTNFPVSQLEVNHRLKNYQKEIKSIKLKTKMAMTKKLLMISLAVKMSHERMNMKDKIDNGLYYGSLNGTTNQKPKRLETEVKALLPCIERQESKQQQGLSETQDNPVGQNMGGMDDELQTLFVLFPVRLFESSRLVSIMFSIFINLAFGICLDYVTNINQTLEYGKFFNILYAFLLLPVLPSISRNEYFNSMCLTSIWKYCLVGIFMFCFLGSKAQEDWKYSNTIQYQIIINLVLIVYILSYILSESSSVYKIPLIFFIGFLLNIGLTYYGIEN